MYHWRTLFKAVTTFRVPFNAGNFFTTDVLLFKNDFAAKPYLFNQSVVMLSHIVNKFIFTNFYCCLTVNFDKFKTSSPT
jgi:hypothetical protein